MTNAVAEKVGALIETEVKMRTYENMCTVMEKVSKLYSVPLKVVRRDLFGDYPYCMGVDKKTGKLCMTRAIADGYCLRHVGDQRPHEPIVMNKGVRHTHLMPSRPVEGCPACEKSKEFRDLPTTLM